MVALRGHVLALLEGVEHFLDFTQRVGKLVMFLKGVGECFNNCQQRNSILVCVRKIGT